MTPLADLRPSAEAALSRAHDALAPLLADPALTLLAAAAGFLSFLVFSALLGLAWARRVLGAILAAGAGALAGLFTYTLGYVVANEPETFAMESYAALSEEALRSGTLLEGFALVLGAGVGLAAARHAWRMHGAASYVAIVCVVSGYLLHAATVALPRVPASALPFSLALFAAEAASLLLVAAHSFYSLDVAARKRWRRRPGEAPFSRYHEPKVAVHVAVYNEPPEMVVATLRSVLALDYPKDRLVVLVLDDSTDEAARAEVARFCRENGVAHHHREDRRGFKAGALNEGLRLTPPDVDLVAVLDADYQVEPRYLRETVGYFIDPTLGFLQTPQDYRNVDESFLTRQYHYADAYFYRAVLPSRNEENAIIFCGTMGILRRQALEECGGWGEAFLTEDAELSVRVLEGGWRSLYVDQTYGRGLIPATFGAYQKQHHRWAYGSVQVLKAHARRILTGRLSARQKADFLMGGLHWFDGVALFVIAALLLGLGVADALGHPVLTHHAGEVWLLGLVPAFLLFDGVLRLHLALRRAMRLPLSATFGVLGMWLSVKFSNARGALKALFGVRMAFARTPKAENGRVTRWRALLHGVGLTRLESTMCALLLGGAVALGARMHALWQAGEGVSATRALLALWLVYYAVVFAMAPLYAYKSLTTCRQTSPAPAVVARPTEAESAH